MLNPITLKNYLESRKLTPLADISNRFKADPDIIRPMLDLWIDKGRLKRYRNGKPCQKGCCGCHRASMEIYEWIG